MEDKNTRFRYNLEHFFVYKQKTAYEMRIRDWSSDVCSSDLVGTVQDLHRRRGPYALQERVQRALEDARRATGACEVHLCDHRNPQGTGDGAVALDRKSVV